MVQQWAGSHDLPRSDRTHGPQVPVLTTVTGEVRFKGDKFCVLDKAKNTSCIGHLRGNLYIIDTKVVTNEHAKVAFVNNFPSEGDDPPPMALAATSSTAIADMTTWHQRLCHLNADVVSMMFGHAGAPPSLPLANRA